jgi:hypothetical protein
MAVSGGCSQGFGDLQARDWPFIEPLCLSLYVMSLSISWEFSDGLAHRVHVARRELLPITFKDIFRSVDTTLT